MIISTITAFLPHEKSEIWDKIVNLDDQLWRKDLIKVVKLNNKEFIEYKKKGITLKFKITNIIPKTLYTLSFESNKARGTFIGRIKEQDNGCLIIFSEKIYLTTNVFKPLFTFFIRLEQKKYIRYLKKELKKA